MTNGSKKILFSGIQPTGEIHIGNYLGALRNWVELQNSKKYNCIYSIVDLHAITIDYDPQKYQEKILATAMDLLAIGINPQKSILFVQSQVPEHIELYWLFNILTPIAELERMTQFKDKAKQHKKNINAGLFDYPVLMAADILLYKSEFVPVGEDQYQHLELANKILRKFNHKFGQYFKEVETIISSGARIMSLTDPAKKMSKSLGQKNYIALNDPPEIIRQKIMKAVTESRPIDVDYFEKFLRNREDSAGIYRGVPIETKYASGVNNLVELFAEFNLDRLKRLFKSNKKIGYAELKAELSEVIIKTLKPIQEKRKKLKKNEVQKILKQGAEKARKIAQKNIAEIKKKMGLI